MCLSNLSGCALLLVLDVHLSTHYEVCPMTVSTIVTYVVHCLLAYRLCFTLPFCLLLLLVIKNADLHIYYYLSIVYCVIASTNHINAVNLNVIIIIILVIIIFIILFPCILHLSLFIFVFATFTYYLFYSTSNLPDVSALLAATHSRLVAPSRNDTVRPEPSTVHLTPLHQFAISHTVR